MAPEAFAGRVRDYFEMTHRRVFEGDPAANPFLEVEVMGAAIAHDTPVLVLIAPWTLCGIAAPPDERFPSALRIGHRPRPALANEIEEIGAYRSVILIPDVSGYTSQDEAREAARPLAEEFEAAVEKARRELTEVADRDRRALFKAVGRRSDPAGRSRTGFGDPDDDSAQHRDP